MTDYYWHFVTVDEHGTPRLGYNDGREVKIGGTLEIDAEPFLCFTGLHASVKLWDALVYASGDKLRLCRVTLGGTVLHGDDKSVATQRTVVAMLDVDATEKLLHDFACWCALQVIHLWNAPDVVRQYLETGDESLRAAARDASEVAADAAWAAAAYTARAADAAWAAAAYTARAAARAAAADVAADAAWAAAAYTARAAAADAAVKIEEYLSDLEQRALAAMGLTE
jgi:hypothetical protein